MIVGNTHTGQPPGVSMDVLLSSVNSFHPKEIAMSDTLSAHRHDEWAEKGLGDYSDFSDRTTDVNQEDRGDHSIGQWFYSPQDAGDPGWIEGLRIIYNGTWGNDNSPGASHYTQAEVFEMPDEEAEYKAALANWEAQPEWAETDNDWEEDEPEDDELDEDEDEEDEDEWEDD